ncbi:putative lipid II flippase FtsW [Actinotalea sp. Marseille-Q4924]|uniref:putative lipid II flippase FtsW n=1 Tax=Actinotalea sp. Marseille-Q4924 TaxID=2866571 RepID=UPI001CE47635|nr:putative lipid II flippase FtsW [Actinotalea sp. Marseille-Q4924]
MPAGVRTHDVEAAPRRRSMGGVWDSAVTSYYLIAGATALLLTIGLVMVLSSSSVDSLSATDGRSPYAIFVNHARFALVGVPVAVVASLLPVRFYRRLAWPALGVAVALQLLVIPLGYEVGGNRAWIRVGGITAQPSEAAKLALAVWLGAVLATKRHLLHQWQHVVVPAVLGAGAVLGLVLYGRDLGTAIVVMVLVAGALFVAGVPLRMLVGAGLVAAGGVAALAITNANRVARITAFFSGDCDTQGACYQPYRGAIALGSGGWTGVGLGESTEKWSYLPEAHNDFIFAIIGEELGLPGTLLVVALFGVLAVAVTRVVRRHTDPFVQIAAAGIGTWVLGQAVINMGVVVGLLPVVGVPLPLVSAGGSALVTTLLALGVLLAFARNEPGAAEALSARAVTVRRSLAVLSRRGSRG